MLAFSMPAGLETIVDQLIDGVMGQVSQLTFAVVALAADLGSRAP